MAVVAGIMFFTLRALLRSCRPSVTAIQSRNV
jgi:hypothetical protein